MFQLTSNRRFIISQNVQNTRSVVVCSYEVVNLSQMLNDPLERNHIQWHLPSIRHYTMQFHTLFWNSTFSTNYKFITALVTAVLNMPTEDAYSYRQLVTLYAGLAYVLHVSIKSISEFLVFFRTLRFKNLAVYLIFTLNPSTWFIMCENLVYSQLE